MTRKAKAIRYRKLRRDASIASIIRFFESFGVPTGSVKLEYPSGRKARTDSTLEKLLSSWEVEREGTEAPPASEPEPKQLEMTDIFEQGAHG